ncbi:diacylglycerol O-acyltransferase 1 [Pocillopora verrucosa]|uniref:diacylglycerol O-acyltransferase 1 n=1 Tax=Pocillopora verrucosa TaxID=203993 RepID=UPI003340388D
MTSSTTRKRSTPKRAENTTEAKASTKSQAKESDYGKRVHEKEESLLTSTSGFDNYRGLINLCLILLVLSNFRVALDNLLKYGLLIDPLQVITIFLEDPYHWPSASLVIFSNVLIQLTFVIEKLLAAGKISERIGRISHMFLLLLMLFVPCTVILVYLPPPWAANIAVFWYTIVWLKLISYVSVNLWYRLGLMKHEKEGHVANGKPETLPLVKYPENLTQKDLYYFIFAPTLCYELNYPRSERIRKRFLLRRLAEFFFIIGIVIGAFQQWIVPTVKNSMKPIQEMDVGRGLERIMKLAVPNHLLWLLFFYAFFHSGLNILAELLRFGDRTFYRDWWNSPNVAYFWQNWNIPVHRWARRHLYIPMLRSGYSSLQAQVAVFLLSAFFHEFLVSVPLRLFRFWAFLAMLAQVPLHLLVKKFLGDYPNYGNMVVWLSIILGQPLAILTYVHDYYITHQ